MESVQLSSSSFLYPPLSPPPTLVLLLGHTKYVAKYRELFPDEIIIVAKSFLRHFFWLPGARSDLAAVADAVLGITKDPSLSPESRPPILLHLFSNTGLSTSWQLDNVFAEKAKEAKPRPRRVTIFDSSPGRYEYWSLASALLHGIPLGQWLQTLVLVPLAHLLSGTLFIWCRNLNGEDWIAKWG
ncbi:uncharacterized protein J7T54_002973 [Emericellopsis cladophorae]|uniref:Uncharacterized protein n=1 Tax=Emericellopsis cladophorae TaxID=2686198 RepID=A0A9P9XTN6_9HYPO|nr:uncharacterized protein J7T54_002973 [Emericellopsis cladophorae]KAI6777654.1 hypothetical protein J7T54_002973 [Emericellopsis cladophorae]